MSSNDPAQSHVGNLFWSSPSFNQPPFSHTPDDDGGMELKQENVDFFNNTLSNQVSNFQPHIYNPHINGKYPNNVNGIPNQASPSNQNFDINISQFNGFDQSIESQNGVAGLGTESLSSYSSPSAYSHSLSNPNYINNGSVLVPPTQPNYSTRPSTHEDIRNSPETSLASVSGADNEKPTLTKSNSKKSNNHNSNGSFGKSKKQILDEQDAILINRDDSELNEEELALKRKAQNRAAQRAFRERKETKLKDLEGKLLRSEEERQKLLEQLEQIKQQNISIQTENQLLRSGNDANPHSIDLFARNANNNIQNNKFTFPESQREFIQSMMGNSGHAINQATVNKIYDEPENPGKKVLAIGAVWDYLQIKAEEQEFEYGLDVYEVMKRLKGNERCHGYGPAYPLELVDQIISQVASGH